MVNILVDKFWTGDDYWQGRFRDSVVIDVWVECQLGDVAHIRKLAIQVKDDFYDYLLSCVVVI